MLRAASVSGHRARGPADIEAEIAFLAHLASTDVPVAAAVPTRDGVLFTSAALPCCSNMPRAGDPISTGGTRANIGQSVSTTRASAPSSTSIGSVSIEHRTSVEAIVTAKGGVQRRLTEMTGAGAFTQRTDLVFADPRFERIVATLRRRGYGFVTVPELLGLPARSGEGAGPARRSS